MATEAQVVANRANAQKSTGPRTPEGKEEASQNALKHGLFAREGVIRGEDGEEFEMHRELLLEHPGTMAGRRLECQEGEGVWLLSASGCLSRAGRRNDEHPEGRGTPSWRYSILAGCQSGAGWAAGGRNV